MTGSGKFVSSAAGPSEAEAMARAAEYKRRVGTAWREIRRGASAIRIRELFYGTGPEGLDMALADALTVLCQRGPLRMGELAEALHITPASTTRAVNCLVQQGYVERVKDEDDQRLIMVSASEQGRQRFQLLNDRVQFGLGRIMAEFNPEEQALLAEFLERFVGSVEQYVASEDAHGHDTDPQD